MGSCYRDELELAGNSWRLKSTVTNTMGAAQKIPGIFLFWELLYNSAEIRSDFQCQLQLIMDGGFFAQLDILVM